MENISITHRNHGDHGVYEAHVEGSEHIGKLYWSAHAGVRHATSTQVPREIGGRGIAGKLVQAMIADAREHGFTIHPACSYVDVAFQRHPEWADLRG